MKILVACEESQEVTKRLREKGHEAWSCDLLDTSGPMPEYHIKGDVLKVLNEDKWDAIIAFPPCTYISNMSNCRIHEPGRREKRREGMEFFLKIANHSCPNIAIENPRGLPEREYRKADQIIQPWMFGHPFSKATCLWLKGFPLLEPTNIVNSIDRKWDGKRYRTWVDTVSSKGNKGNKAKARSKTFSGIAQAMADQWFPE